MVGRTITPTGCRAAFQGFGQSSMDRVGFHEEPSHEASVYAHGLHGAGFHDVVQGHIPTHQGSLKISLPFLLSGRGGKRKSKKAI